MKIEKSICFADRAEWHMKLENTILLWKNVQGCIGNEYCHQYKYFMNNIAGKVAPLPPGQPPIEKCWSNDWICHHKESV